MEEGGAVGDRLCAITDERGKIGSGTTTRRFRRFDGLSDRPARAVETPIVVLPDGPEVAVG